MSRVEFLRKAHGWSRLELASRAGVTESTIIRAERRSPTALQARNLEKIARAFDVPIGELLKAPNARRAKIKNTPSGRPAVTVLGKSAPDRDVLFIHDLAYELRSTVRRLRMILKTEPWKLPERLPSIDKRDRWSRLSVDRWLELLHPERKRATARLIPAGR